jgi:tetratricopeptide (TPR) repeat protein
MKIVFGCRNCGKRFSFEETGAGIMVQCPGCGQETNLQTGILRVAIGVLGVPGETPFAKQVSLKLQDVIDQERNGKISETQARLEMKQFNQSIGYEPPAGKQGTLEDLSDDDRLHLIFRTAGSLVAAARNWLTNANALSLRLYPCQELSRKFNRMHPRKSSNGVENGYWIERWQKLGGQLFDGRMIARKDATICSEISEFGLPFGPPAFGSGYGWRPIDCEVSARLGVVAKNEYLELPPLDLQRCERKMREHFELLISPETQSNCLVNDDAEEDDAEQFSIENHGVYRLIAEADKQTRLLGKEIDWEAGNRVLKLWAAVIEQTPNDNLGFHAAAYRGTGEILETMGEKALAVEYYGYALQKNPKIGVKKRLATLQKELSTVGSDKGTCTQ